MINLNYEISSKLLCANMRLAAGYNINVDIGHICSDNPSQFGMEGWCKQNYYQTSLFKCSLNIAWQGCFNYIFILNLTPSLNGLGKDNCKTRQETLMFLGLNAPYIRDLVADIKISAKRCSRNTWLH